ncbi:unnamed protein product [Malus baccata var. baccata]
MRCSCFGASVAERKRKSGSGQFGHDLDENVLENIKAFSYNELRSVTDNFHPSNKIGRGGFGTVYKGKGSTINIKGKITSANKKGPKGPKRSTIFINLKLCFFAFGL